MIHVTAHAVSRYRERVEPVGYDEAVAALTSPAVQAAFDFGARFVRLAGGQRIVIEDGRVVTVLPADNYRKQVQRKGFGRYGKSNGPTGRDDFL